MALKIDEDYSGLTLLSAWWQQVKNNFTKITAAVNSEALERESKDNELAEDIAELSGRTLNAVNDGSGNVTLSIK